MGTEPCPFFWALSSGQSLKVLDYFQGLQNPSLRSPRGGWLAVSQLPGAFWEQPGTAAAGWHQWTSVQLRVEWKFPCGFDGGHVLSPQGSQHPSSLTTVQDTGRRKDLVHESSHFKDWFSNFLSFLNETSRAYHKGDHSAWPLGLHYFTEMPRFVLLCSMLLESRLGGALDAHRSGSEFPLCGMHHHFTSPVWGNFHLCQWGSWECLPYRLVEGLMR